MQAQKFGHWYRLIVKILIPVAFAVVAVWPKGYWMAGIMTIVVLFAYVLEWQKIGDKSTTE